MKFIQKLSDIFFSILIRIAQILLVIMVALVFTNVVLRYVFNSGIYWSEEASLVIVIWFTFIAFALGVKEDLHISISVLPRKMSRFTTVFLTFFKSAVEIICGYILFIYGIKLTRTAASSLLPATGLSNAFTYLIVPICAVFIILFAIFHLLNPKGNK